MAYVAVKGGERAIRNAHAWLAEERRGDPTVPDLGLAQIREQLGRAIDRVMAEGSCYDPELAALAIKQAQGDLIEAVFLLRAYRTTLPRFAHSAPIDTARIAAARRISAIFKDVPGGQILGPTYDYTHRLLDFELAENQPPPEAPLAAPDPSPMPRVHDILGREGLLEADGPATCGCRLWRAATKGSCWRWDTRPNAATAAAIPSPARSASVTYRLKSPRRNLVSLSI
jgi:alpha-D-ribose 1-methylphosphonate 5-triphosphate synthase subunit PhnI